MTPEEAKRKVENWAKDKPLWEDVRNLAGHIIHAEIFGKVHRQPTGTNYVRGPNDIDLDRLYDDLTQWHPAVMAKLAKRGQKKHAKAEPVRNSIAKAMGREVSNAPRKESVRESINRAREEARDRRS